MSGVESLVTQINNTSDTPRIPYSPSNSSGRTTYYSNTPQHTPVSQPWYTRCWNFFCCRKSPRVPDRPSPQNDSSSSNSSSVIRVPDTSPIAPSPAAQPQLTMSPLLPPMPSGQYKKTLVLDLDETLIHSSFRPIPDAQFQLEIVLSEDRHAPVFVRKRPHVDEFLKHVAKKWEVVIFTASMSQYADPLLDILDTNRVVSSRLFRESCIVHFGNYVKDLSQLGRRLEHTVIIDNSPISYMFQPDHAIPIPTWLDDPHDNQLRDILPLLDELADCDDVTEVMKRAQIHFATGAYVPPQSPSRPMLVTDDDDS